MQNLQLLAQVESLWEDSADKLFSPSWIATKNESVAKKVWKPRSHLKVKLNSPGLLTSNLCSLLIRPVIFSFNMVSQDSFKIKKYYWFCG
jgi:hypothetical protein